MNDKIDRILTIILQCFVALLCLVTMIIGVGIWMLGGSVIIRLIFSILFISVGFSLGVSSLIMLRELLKEDSNYVHTEQRLEDTEEAT